VVVVDVVALGVLEGLEVLAGLGGVEGLIQTVMDTPKDIKVE
jgi:hypothetical protein